MKPGIDLTVDFAFKRVFGHERNGDILISLLNAVLDRPGFQKVVEVTVLNPFSIKEAIDDKVTIVDIRAVDQAGRQFFVEMQVVAGASFPKRILYYWAQRHGKQLVEAEDYSKATATIGLCFVSESTSFPNASSVHSSFRLLDGSGKLNFCEDIEIHLLELAKFRLEAELVDTPLDRWLYVLKNSIRLDSTNLPLSLQDPQIRRTLEELTMLTQDQQEYEAYFTREKSKRDALYAQNNLARPGLYERTRMGQRLLGLAVSDLQELENMAFDKLCDLADRLEGEVRDRLQRN